ncbi:4-hydroxy-3-methylbut-2-en-1-yl diphosphate synthase (flavodoxin)-like [Capsicum annuum]|uniref:4-hydroxy-3-methylbut-2-en-1-yl diphosphate synthase (flavodoxin)-like n=1 Tax=Capsicum annuum TaxID=4072 RepID=UPI001FB10BEC|nr:4-hydroxy-3-methylbut-2-en-1-yl diphosphate synthase (flavodoxin)-like [Capsicum annuum]XP_047262304.1 4-hydroxy-3-methylbut-2-en-1-yl diphosphate synthase (flavodoxin)-like [Capsicum annuum]
MMANFMEHNTTTIHISSPSLQSVLHMLCRLLHEKVIKIVDAGADIVRITVQGKKEVDACFEIKNSLVQKNYNIPLVADIFLILLLHFEWRSALTKYVSILKTLLTGEPSLRN